MSHLTKLTIAVGLAMAAAMANMTWLSSQAKPTMFVSVGIELEQGQPIAEESLVPVPVPGETEQLRATLIPWSSRAAIIDYPAPRSFAAGDLVFRQDIRPQSDRLNIVGPFRIVGDEERLGRKPDEGYERQRDGIVMIAVNADLDDRTKALLQMLAPNQDELAISQSVVSVQIVPPQSASALDDQPTNIVYQPVALRGLENAPSDLQPGEHIRFVVAQ